MEFNVAGGTVPGTEHTKPGKPGWINNQDAFGWRQTDNCLVAVVCDGCGSGKHSEVGAKVAVSLLTEILAESAEKYVRQIATLPEEQSELAISFDWNRVKTLVLSHIAVIARAMGGSFSQTINDHFLFTVVGAVITPWNTFLFSVGDGVFVVNGEVFRLGPFPNNAPPYITYSLVGSSLTGCKSELLDIQVNKIIPTNELQSLLVGSDGVLELIDSANKKLPQREGLVGPIDQFWTDDQYFKNDDAVRRRLAMINMERAEIDGVNLAAGAKPRVVGGLLSDDTTLIVIRPDPNKKDEV